MMIESGIRGGISMIAHRYAKANNKYLPDYDESQESSYLSLMKESALQENDSRDTAHSYRHQAPLRRRNRCSAGKKTTPGRCEGPPWPRADHQPSGPRWQITSPPAGGGSAKVSSSLPGASRCLRPPAGCPKAAWTWTPKIDPSCIAATPRGAAWGDLSDPFSRRDTPRKAPQ